MTDTGKRRWPRKVALDVAREICNRLKPVCERLVVAGSLRRGKPAVGDVEILFIPRCQEEQEDLIFMRTVDLADQEIQRMLEDGTITKRPTKTGGLPWGPKNKLALHRNGMPVDFFCTEKRAWFNYLVCRTGPADSNTRIATAAKEKGYKWNPYGPGFTRLNDGQVFPMGSEEEVFQFVGLPYLPPDERR